MTFHKRAGILSSAFCLLFPAGRAKAQCFSGDDFAVCPAEDTVYLMNDQSLGALSASEGKVKWQIRLPSDHDESFLGPVATADAVVVYAGFPNTHIHAFDTATGRPIWDLKTSSRNLDSFGSYILINDPKFWDGLTALEGKTGKPVWHHPASTHGTELPSASEKVLLTKFHALNADTGQTLHNWPKGWDVSAMFLADNIRAIGTRDGRLEAYSSPGYKIKWTRHDSRNRPVAGLAGDENNLLVAWHGAVTGGDEDQAEFYEPGHVTLQLLAVASGAVLWSKEIDCNRVLPSPVALVKGLAIFVSGVLPNSGVVEAFDTSTGRQKWIAHTDRKLTSGPVCSSEHCYIGSLSHDVLVVDVQSGAQSWLALPKK